MIEPPSNKGTVILLAAGMGSRLGELTGLVPKALVKIYGKSLLERLMDNFIANDLKKFLLVTGHAKDFTETSFGEMIHGKPIEAEAVYNGKYRSYNNAYSLLMGVSNSDKTEPIYIVNTDTVFDGTLLADLKVCKTSCLLVDNKKKLTQESMKVHAPARKLVGISKRWDILNSHGEYMGIAKIMPEDISKLIIALKAVIKVDPNMFYEDAFQLMTHWTHIEAIWTQGSPWTEIDTPEDLEQAKRILQHERSDASK